MELTFDVLVCLVTLTALAALVVRVVLEDILGSMKDLLRVRGV